MKRYGMRQPLQEFEKFLEMFWLCYAWKITLFERQRVCDFLRMYLTDRLSHRTTERRSRCHMPYLAPLREIKFVIWNNNMNLRSLYEQDGYWNKAKFLLASRADKPSFAQTRCAQTVRSVTAASAKLVTKLDQGSCIRPVIDPAVFMKCFTWNIIKWMYWQLP